jgi:hypothetical protein
MASPVDIGGLPNHVKYCVSVLNLKWINIRTSPVEIPYKVNINKHSWTWYSLLKKSNDPPPHIIVSADNVDYKNSTNELTWGLSINKSSRSLLSWKCSISTRNLRLASPYCLVNYQQLKMEGKHATKVIYRGQSLRGGRRSHSLKI